MSVNLVPNTWEEYTLPQGEHHDLLIGAGALTARCCRSLPGPCWYPAARRPR